MKVYRDQCFFFFDELIKKLHEENKHQVNKWGIQERSIFEWLTYTTEELGELAEAISEYEYRDGSKDHIIKEAIQVATLTLKIAEMYMSEEQKPIEKPILKNNKLTHIINCPRCKCPAIKSVYGDDDHGNSGEVHYCKNNHSW